MRILRVDLKRALFSKQMVYAILLGMGVVLVGMLFEPIKSALSLYYSNAADLTVESKTMLIGNSFNKVTLWSFGNFFYPLAIPLICCIPFSIEYIRDKKNGLNKFIIIRSNYREYVWSRIITTFISGFVAIFIISIITLILINILETGNEFRSIYYENIFLSDLSSNNFNGFVIVHGIIMSFMGGVYALLGLAISSFVDKPLIAFISPFFIYYIGNYVMGTLNLIAIHPDIVAGFYKYEDVSGIYILGQLLFIFTCSVLVFLRNTYWSDVYE